MLKIRLKRQGRKHRPFYRIVLTDSRNRRDGKPLEELGFYNPIEKKLRLDKAKAEEWLGKGAQISDTAKWLLSKASGDSAEVIQLDLKREEKASRKVQARLKEQEDIKKKAEEAAAAEAKAAAEAAAAPVAEETPAAEEAPAEEAPAAEEETPAEA